LVIIILIRSYEWGKKNRGEKEQATSFEVLGRGGNRGEREEKKNTPHSVSGGKERRRGEGTGNRSHS